MTPEVMADKVKMPDIRLALRNKKNRMNHHSFGDGNAINDSINYQVNAQSEVISARAFSTNSL